MLKDTGGAPCLVGTWIESESSISDMAQRLGQYMYVLNQQQMGESQIQKLGSAKQVMKMYGKILEKILTAFDREMSRILKIVCDRLLNQKNSVVQSSNTIVPQSSAISDINNENPENSHSRLSHQTSNSEAVKRALNVDAEPASVSEAKAVMNKIDDDFSSQVIKENNILRAQTSRKYQRNEPIIDSSSYNDSRQGPQETAHSFSNPI